MKEATYDSGKGYKPAGDKTGGKGVDGTPITGGYMGSGETRKGEKSVINPAPHGKKG